MADSSCGIVEYNYNLLANYNKNANALMCNCIKASPDWDKQFPAYFKSVHELCSHLYISDCNWLRRFKTLREFSALNNKIFERKYDFGELLFSNIDEYIPMRTALDDILIAFIAEITSDDLKLILHYEDWEGKAREKRFDGLLIHLFNHETHHRAMISIFLEMTGKENDYNNVLPFVSVVHGESEL